MWFRGADIAAMGGGDEDRAPGVSSLANKEPLVVVKASVDIMREVIRKNRSDSRDSVIREGETPLRRGGRRSVCEGALGTEDRDIGRTRGTSGHRRSGVFVMRRGDEDIVGVNGDVFMEWGEEEGVEDFLSDLGGSGRHRW